MNRFGAITSIVAVMLLSPIRGYGQHTIVDLKDFSPDEFYVEKFSVTSASDVHVEAVGAMSKSSKWNKANPMLAYGWMLNGDTRELVWAMNVSNVKEEWGSRNVRFEGTISLKPGTYEVYYSTFAQKIVRISGSESYLNEFLKNLVKVFIDDQDVFDDIEDWRLRITCKDSDRDRFTSAAGASANNVIVSLTGARDYDFLEKGFSLDRDMRVRIYCNGEGLDDRMYDFGWITNDQTLRQVWEMQYRMTSHGGGAEKNRTYSGIVTLPAGDYVATYVTDDSHSPDEWNMQPPYDPSYWGLTIFATDPSDLKFMHEYKKSKRTEFLSITRVGDRQYRSEGFKLSRKTDVLVYALGEGRDGHMYDYGWITDEQSGERVWEMRFYDTKLGGGDEKNRLFEGIVSLDPGKYRVHYVTDGSHSYEDWNANPPFNQTKWGITLILVSAKDAGNVSKLDEGMDKSILAQITQVGDDEYRRTPFKLDKASRIRITCLGEGKYGRMFDYGWIKNARTGLTVWEMTYAMTQHAGGGKKNRIFDAVVLLEAGEYEMFYITDGSHSFDDWNDDPPAQPELWGMTVRLIK
jgi:hypothetical protein